MKYIIKDDRLVFDNGKETKFLYKIEETLDFSDITIVRIDSPKDVVFNENVYGVDRQGDVVWQIQKVQHIKDTAFYTSIYKQGNNLGLYDGSGYEVLADPLTGAILKREFTK